MLAFPPLVGGVLVGSTRSAAAEWPGSSASLARQGRLPVPRDPMDETDERLARLEDEGEQRTIRRAIENSGIR